MTKVIAIVSEKGGAGKTTASVSLAVASEAAGLGTVIFDLDPRANASTWGDYRKKAPDVLSAHASRLQVYLNRAREQNVDLVLIDTPGNALDIAELVCGEADLILIPCKPAPPDLISVPATVKKALASGRPAYVLINDAPPQGPEVKETTAVIERKGVRVCPVVWGHRKDFIRGFHMGLTAPEIDRKCLAAQEIAQLFSWVRETMGLKVEASHVI